MRSAFGTDNDPGLCADLANAIVDAFADGVVARERQQKIQTLNRLEEHLKSQTELEKKKRADVEALREMLGPSERGPTAREERVKLEVEQLRQGINRVREEMLAMRLAGTETDSRDKPEHERVCLDLRWSDWRLTLALREAADDVDPEAHLARYRRYEEELQRAEHELEAALEQLPAVQFAALGKHSFEVETRQHEIELLKEQVDELYRLEDAEQKCRWNPGHVWK